MFLATLFSLDSRSRVFIILRGEKRLNNKENKKHKKERERKKGKNKKRGKEKIYPKEESRRKSRQIGFVIKKKAQTETEEKQHQQKQTNKEI